MYMYTKYLSCNSVEAVEISKEESAVDLATVVLTVFFMWTEGSRESFCYFNLTTVLHYLHYLTPR